MNRILAGNETERTRLVYLTLSSRHVIIRHFEPTALSSPPIHTGEYVHSCRPSTLPINSYALDANTEVQYTESEIVSICGHKLRTICQDGITERPAEPQVELKSRLHS